MKKTILAMAALAACMSTASAQTSVTIYGIVDAGIAHITNDGPTGDRTTVEAGQMQTSRWGFKGTEDLGGGLKARFALEGTLLNDTGAAGVPTGTPATTSLFDREATVGISGNFGSIDIGRQNILGIGSVGLADPMGLAFAANSPNVLFGAMNFGAVYGAYGANGAGNSALRQTNSIKYVSPTLGGVGFGLMRAFGEQAGGIQRGSYQGASLFYNAGPFGAAGAYARMKNNLNTDLLTSWGVGAKYTMARAVIKGTYIRNEVDSTNRTIAVAGVGVDVPVAPALTLTGAVYNTKRYGDQFDQDSQQYHLIGRYALSKRSTVYAAYTRANTSDVVDLASGTAAGFGAGIINLAQGVVAPGSDKANRFTVGVMHMF
ncbi:porin [Massilia suwonensis]|uniref:Porin n=1 Tax=Massilia suwonensis TaxID=648895 RepID=A0ABW0ML60_9BURK